MNKVKIDKGTIWKGYNSYLNILHKITNIWINSEPWSVYRSDFIILQIIGTDNLECYKDNSVFV